MTKRREIPDLLLRDVPQPVIDALERHAALHGRSPEAEHRFIIEQALRADFRERAAKLRAETRGRMTADSTDLIRQDRDQR